MLLKTNKDLFLSGFTFVSMCKWEKQGVQTESKQEHSDTKHACKSHDIEVETQKRKSQKGAHASPAEPGDTGLLSSFQQDPGGEGHRNSTLLVLS